jgi:predicted acylesterase/phospholipase RssA
MNTNLKEELIQFLNSVSFLKNMPKKHLSELADYFELIHIEGDQFLIKKGELGDCLYIVHSGSFLAYKTAAQGKKIHLSEIKKTELIGELALFTEEKRAANVIAIRDSMVWRLSKQNFDDFFQKYPDYVRPMIKPIILRLLNKTGLKNKHRASIALFPAGKAPLNRDFVLDFVKNLKMIEPTILINYYTVKQKFPGIDFSKSLEDSSLQLKLLSWLSDLEVEYNYIIYEIDDSLPIWSDFCKRQADKILLIGDAKDSPKLGALEAKLFDNYSSSTRKIKLILLHEGNQQVITNTHAWLKYRPVEITHIRLNHQKDMERICRIETGRGIGLVLGGGGAKSLAHIGVYKALCELNIPVDLVAGTSMGSIIAANIGLEYTPELMQDMLLKQVISNKKFYDYTLPFYSLLEGKGWLDALKNFFPEEICIEDLWKNFFCIASNFTTREMEIMRSGSLFKAVRASCSIPAVVPPISNEKHELLIDGGIFNNLPVNIMKKLAYPCQIIAIRVSPSSYFHANLTDGVLSGMRYYFSKFRKNILHQRNESIPNIAEMIVGSITMHNDKNELIQMAQANYALDLDLRHIGILDFSKYQQAIDFGYRHAIEKFTACDIGQILS